MVNLVSRPVARNTRRARSPGRINTIEPATSRNAWSASLNTCSPAAVKSDHPGQVEQDVATICGSDLVKECGQSGRGGLVQLPEQPYPATWSRAVGDRGEVRAPARPVDDAGGQDGGRVSGKSVSDTARVSSSDAEGKTPLSGGCDFNRAFTLKQAVALQHPLAVAAPRRGRARSQPA